MLKVLAVTNIVFTNESRRRGLRAKNPKPSHYGLVLGLPCQMAMVGGAGWWRCILVEVVGVVGITFANVSGGRGVWGCVYANAAGLSCRIYTATHHAVT